MQFGFGAIVDGVACVKGLWCVCCADIDAVDMTFRVVGRKHIGPGIIGQHDIAGIAGNVVGGKHRFRQQVHIGEESGMELMDLASGW